MQSSSALLDAVTHIAVGVARDVLSIVQLHERVGGCAVELQQRLRRVGMELAAKQLAVRLHHADAPLQHGECGT